MIHGDFILQVDEVCDIGRAMTERYSGQNNPRRMLKIRLSDGARACPGAAPPPGARRLLPARCVPPPPHTPTPPHTHTDPRSFAPRCAQGSRS